MTDPQTVRRERVLGVLRQFRILVRAMRAHYQQVADRSGLGGAQAWALAEIAQGPGVSVGELARRLALQLSTVSNLVKGLEALGLVKRARGAADQRVVRLEATREGRKAMRGMPGPARGVLQQALQSLPALRLRALHRELGTLVGALDSSVSPSDGVTLDELLAQPKPRARAPQPPRNRRPTSGSSRSSRPAAARATRPATRT